ncbi:MAG: hypothetical protein CVT63_02455 [Candidatus Anoxymicrobium japonicum]|uniref:Uncharacterized protein n=1 Tax=Candidatus Anoxymicrobium japonicum TaxID=2013648 RepID=A0A2N3G700_9ACTN|nr:MAG: hypothetical protein CVT63_02455 [Candidatus Anoxymicrobium japonicum]
MVLFPTCRMPVKTTTGMNLSRRPISADISRGTYFLTMCALPDVVCFSSAIRIMPPHMCHHMAILLPCICKYVKHVNSLTRPTDLCEEPRKERWIMSKVEVFDPSMCCSTGVCGPDAVITCPRSCGSSPCHSSAFVRQKHTRLTWRTMAFQIKTLARAQRPFCSLWTQVIR